MSDDGPSLQRRRGRRIDRKKCLKSGGRYLALREDLGGRGCVGKRITSERILESLGHPELTIIACAIGRKLLPDLEFLEIFLVNARPLRGCGTCACGYGITVEEFVLEMMPMILLPDVDEWREGVRHEILTVTWRR